VVSAAVTRPCALARATRSPCEFAPPRLGARATSKRSTTLAIDRDDGDDGGDAPGLIAGEQSLAAAA
jgi:hypothetical protein